MHAAATSLLFVSLLGQFGGGYSSGGFGKTASEEEYGEPMSVTSEAKTTRATSRGATRAVRAPSSNPLTDTYPRVRVATTPRYASDTSSESTLPPVGNASRVAREDPQSVLADKLLRDLIQPTQGDQNVQSLRLIDALERTSGSQQQFTAIKAYWDWALAVSELYGVAEEDHFLSEITVPRNRAESDAAAHLANRKASHSRLEDSKLDVAAKVSDLVDAAGLRATTLRPADVPFVGVYNTNFSKLFPGTTAPATLKKIHQTLPYALKVVRSRADSYESAREAVVVALADYKANKTSYNDVSDALIQMRSQRRAFLDSVHDYNFAIAEYALSIAGPGLERQTVVSMLIRTSTTNRGPYRGASLDVPRDVMPVSGVEEIEPFYANRIAADDSLQSLPPPPDFGDQPVRRQVHSLMVR